MRQPVSGDRWPLQDALAIAGARSVAVFADGVPAWSAGGREPVDAEAMAAVALAGAADVLTRLADPRDDLGDVLVTTASYFHLLRVLRPAGGDRQVAHLMLARDRAHLATARLEFRLLAERHAAAALAPPGPPPLESPPPGPLPSLPARPPRAELPPGPAAGPGSLPRRRPGATAGPPPDDPDGDPAMPPGWFAMAGQPFHNDDTVLDRILGTLQDL